MSTDPARLRYLADAVATATPAQRIVMLYDRLGLDIERAAAVAGVPFAPGTHLRHAQRIVAELMTSLDTSAWSGAEDLASLYGYLLRELISANAEPDAIRLRAAGRIVADLRSSWFAAGQELAETAAPAPRVAVVSGAWVS